MKQLKALPEDASLGDQTNMLLKETHIPKGNGWMIVTATAMDTELGKITKMVHAAKQSATPLEKKLETFSKLLIKITLGIVIIVFIVGILNGHEVWTMLETAIALAVAAIPEGLPIVATMALAQGMMKMAHRNVIVKRLSSVETLGSTTVICTDKTGTLTENEMTVVDVRTAREESKTDKLIARENLDVPTISEITVLCNTAERHLKDGQWQELGDPLELALLHYAAKAGCDIAATRDKYTKIEEQSFSSETKLMATLHEREGDRWVFAKGAAEELLAGCDRILAAEGEVKLTALAREHWLNVATQMAEEGKRIIAAAYKQDEGTKPLTQHLVFVGLIGMIDPPRPEVSEAIVQCKKAGIEVVMITGDHPATAKYIAVQLGIADEEAKVVLGKEMDSHMTQENGDKVQWSDTRIFARVSPKNKLQLISALQSQGQVVGMTGDGVNDAPALKKADIGVAMGKRGTQVAQDVADVVLKDDNFSSIVDAIKQGRVIAENIKKFVIFLLSCNLSELVVIGIAAIMNLHFQLFPLQILFINIVTDVLPALALGVTAGSASIMEHQPYKLKDPILDAMRWKAVFFYAVVLSASSLGAALASHYVLRPMEPLNSSLSNNILFYALMFSQLLHVINMNKAGTHFFNSEVIKNRFVWLALGGSLAIVLLAYWIVPIREVLGVGELSGMDWLVAISAAFVSLGIIQLAKTLKIVRQ